MARKKSTSPVQVQSGKTKRGWPFPRTTLEQALKIAYAIRGKHGGNPWDPNEIRSAIGAAAGNTYFYLTAASRDYGLTVGTRDSSEISLTELGRDLVYAPNPETERACKLRAFHNIDVFKRVLEYYKGSNLPEMKYLGNTLQKEFELAPETHDEFSRIFRENCQYLNLTDGLLPSGSEMDKDEAAKIAPGTVTLAEAGGSSQLVAFVIIPFVERDPLHAKGFFAEVLRSLITPAASKSGFTVRTANRQGSDVIQSTIIGDLIEADLVIADLTEHNPNVMFELGVRMAEDKPVVLIKALGTGQVFDIDNMLRVFEYNPSLWQTTVEKDLPNLLDFITGAWENRGSEKSYIKILKGAKKTNPSE